MAADWNNNPHQGSAFHKLVVLPTVAPQLVRPYHVPGTPEYYAAEAARRQQAVPAENPGLALTCILFYFSDNCRRCPRWWTSRGTFWCCSGCSRWYATDIFYVYPYSYCIIVKETKFFVLVTAEWLERNAKATRGARSKKCAETKHTPDQVAILSLTRADFVAAALAAHGLQNSYVAGSVSGPNMKISWSGSLCVFNLYSKYQHWLV